MPWDIRKGAGDCSGYAVVVQGSGRVVGCHKTRREASAQQRALYANAKSLGEGLWSEKDFNDALSATFERAKRAAARIMLPLAKKWYIMGAALGTQSRASTVARGVEATASIDKILLSYPDLAAYWEEVDAAADDYIEGYFDEWWGQLTLTTRERLRSAIQIARTQGLEPKDVKRLISAQFGEARAEMVAVTEMTRLLGGGAQATYRAMGLQEWAWETVRDELVCPACGLLQGVRFPMSTLFSPLHPLCRCWPRSVPVASPVVAR